MLWLGGDWFAGISARERERRGTYWIVMHDILMAKMVGRPVEILRRGAHPAHCAVGRVGAGVGAVGGV